MTYLEVIQLLLIILTLFFLMHLVWKLLDIKRHLEKTEKDYENFSPDEVGGQDI